MHLAVTHRQPAALRALIELGANVESLDEAGFTPPDHAALIGASDLASTLIDMGATLRLPAAAALGREAELAPAASRSWRSYAGGPLGPPDYPRQRVRLR